MPQTTLERVPGVSGKNKRTRHSPGQKTLGRAETAKLCHGLGREISGGKRRKVIGWDEILEGGLGPDAPVHSWRGMGGAVEAVKQGHDAILSPTSHCYFDYDQEKVTQIDKVYSLNPVPEGFDSEKMTHILGDPGKRLDRVYAHFRQSAVHAAATIGRTL